MKKIMLVCALSAFGLGAFAQNDTQRVPQKDYEQDKTKYGKEGEIRKDNTEYGEDKKYDRNMDWNKEKQTGQSQKNDSLNKDCSVKMVNGKVMKVKPDGSQVALDKDMTLPNGSVVMANGTVKMKDGKTVKIKEGECLNMSGRIIPGRNTMMDGTK